MGMLWIGPPCCSEGVGALPLCQVQGGCQKAEGGSLQHVLNEVNHMEAHLTLPSEMRGLTRPGVNEAWG